MKVSAIALALSFALGSTLAVAQGAGGAGGAGAGAGGADSGGAGDGSAGGGGAAAGGAGAAGAGGPGGTTGTAGTTCSPADVSTPDQEKEGTVNRPGLPLRRESNQITIVIAGARTGAAL